MNSHRKNDDEFVPPSPAEAPARPAPEYSPTLSPPSSITSNLAASPDYAALEVALRQQNDYLTALHEITLSLMNRLDVNDLLAALIVRAAGLLHAEHGYLYLLSEDEQHMEVRITVGAGLERTVGRRIACGEGLAGRIWDAGGPMSVADYSSWPHRSSLYADYPDMHAMSGVPLKSGAQVVGVLIVVSFERGRRFSDEEMLLLGQFAELASIALDNARLYTATQQALAEREAVEVKLRQQNEYLLALHQTTLALLNHLDMDNLLRTILLQAGALIGTAHGYIYMVDEDGQHITVRVGVGQFLDMSGYQLDNGEGLAGRVWQSGEPLVVNDYSRWPGRTQKWDNADMRAVAGVPLKFGAGVVGVLCVVYFEAGRSFSAEQIAWLGKFAELASLALYNAQLHHARQQELAERTATQEALRESEARYRSISELTSDCVYSCAITPDGKLEVQWTTEAFTRLTGYTWEELDARGGWPALTHPEDITTSLLTLSEVLRTQQPCSAEFRIVTKAGDVRWVVAYTKPERDSQHPHRVYLLGALQDITERKQADEALRENEQRYRALFENTNDGVTIYGLDGTIIAVNQRVSEMLGYTADELVGMKIWDMVAARQRGDGETKMNAMLAGHDIPIYERTLVTKDGHEVEVEISVALVRDAEGRPLHIQSVHRDITVRKQADEQLRLLSSAVRNSSEAIVITGAETVDGQEPTVLYANDAYYRISGYSAEDVIGKPTQVLHYAKLSDEQIETIRATLLEHKSTRIEALNHKKDGTPFWAEITLEPIMDENGECHHWVTIERDITEHKQYEQQLLYLSTHDYLTELPNRRWLEERLAQVVANSSPTNESALMFIDLDGFKVINDTTPLGHAAGDIALKQLAAMLGQQLRGGDILARVGGDEFAVLLEHTTIKRASQIARRLRAVVEKEPLHIAGYHFPVRLSLGLVAIDGQQSVRSVLFQADTAMFIAKRQGGNRVIIYGPPVDRQ